MTKQKETVWESETRTAAAPRRPCLGLLHSWPDPIHTASAAQRRAPDTHTDPIVGGEGGIRTLGDLRHTRFPSVRLRPLGHLSEDPRTGLRLPYPVDGKGGKEHAPNALHHGMMAEREGFEPSVAFQPHWFSKPAHSAALAPLRLAAYGTAACARRKGPKSPLLESPKRLSAGPRPRLGHP